MIEKQVREDELDFLSILASLLEGPGCDFVVEALEDDSLCVTMGNNRGALTCEDRVAHVMVTVKLTVDDPAYGRIGSLANLREQKFRIVWVRSRVDDQNAFVGDQYG